MYDNLTSKGETQAELPTPETAEASIGQRLLAGHKQVEYMNAKYDRDEFREELRNRPKLWIHWLMQDFLPADAVVPDMHEELFLLLITLSHLREDQKDFVQILAFRSMGKTMIVVCAIAYLMAFGLRSYCMYVSATTQNALNQTRWIFKLLTSERFQKVFGKVDVISHDKNLGLYEFLIAGHQTVVLARSMEQDPRGNTIQNKRADYQIFDDIEGKDNSNTEEKSKALEKTMLKDFRQAAQLDGAFFVQIGNLVNKHSMLLRREANPKHVHCVRIPAIRPDGTVTCPELFGIEAMQKKHDEFADAGALHEFYAEFMNILTPQCGLINEDDIELVDFINPADVKEAFLTIDPAISSKADSDENAIVVHVHLGDHQNGKPVWIIAEVISSKHMPPEAMWRFITLLSDKWGIKLVAIEHQGAQQLYGTLFEQYQRSQGYRHLMFRPVRTYNKAKISRIQAWADYLRLKEYKISRSAYRVVGQLMEIDIENKNNKDDIVDACAYGLQVITEYRGLLKVQGQNTVKEIKLAPRASTHGQL